MTVKINRLNKLILAIGRRGTGKTTIALLLAKKSGRKICVIDTDGHPSYDKDFLTVDISYLQHWKSGNIRVITDNPEAVLMALNKYCSSAFIIMEDCGKIIDANIQKPIKHFLIDHRKRDFDVLLMFHFINEVTTYVAKQYDDMILFKTGDNPEQKQLKFRNWHTIKKAAMRIDKHKNFNYCEKISIDE